MNVFLSPALFALLSFGFAAPAELYRRGINVGLDHIGSLVDTFVLACTGAALPLLVLLTVNDLTFARAVNLELIATEVVYTLVGAIGLILAVPVTTLLFGGDRLPRARGAGSCPRPSPLAVQAAFYASFTARPLRVAPVSGGHVGRG